PARTSHCAAPAAPARRPCWSCWRACATARLSGGQAQRVALARLFLRDPGLILLDEPAAHLDAATQARVLDEVLAFAQGRTLLLATHADAVARRLPRQWMLEQGRLRELQPA
ncbi:ATP-binding cassette domain-containing protein, partial [Bordetella pertussis]|uniref:ATP-binding cassette domain-containing protein n=1 Tax=Bordetella pertussis TaxID=520 RepID=UPI0021CB94C9